MRIQINEAGKGSRTIEMGEGATTVGRSKSCDMTFGSDVVSGQHAVFRFENGTGSVSDLGATNGLFVDGKPVSGTCTLKNGSRIELGKGGPQLIVLGGLADSAKQDDVKGAARFPIGNGGIIGRGADCQFRLDHSLISRHHAQIKIKSGRPVIVDLRSTNGTYVNGTLIKSSTELRPGDSLDIGPYSLVYDGTTLASRSRANNVNLDVDQVCCVVTDANTRRPLQLLNDVTFRVEPGEFVAILGPSGSGKSTLLTIISGRNWPVEGQVKVNGRDLHRNFGAIKEDLVVVPQSSVLHESLTVVQTVSYAARLRLPADTRTAEIAARVQAVLDQVGLSHRSATQVKQLSGGQLKRLGLACELISDPSLLFLDEVTSGLDERADEEMMSLFGDLASSGKTLVCVTHNLSSVEAFCHKILVLTVGGQVAFFGTPREARNYFRVRELGEIYVTLDKKQPSEWNAAFLASPYNSLRRPKRQAVSAEVRRLSPMDLARVGLRPIQQTLVLISRYIAIWMGNLPALGAMIGQAVLVTVLLCLVFGKIPDADGSDPSKLTQRVTELRNLLFLIGVSCLWLGANNSAKEIIKERKIYQRERNFNLVPESYWISKVFVLAIIGFTQSTVLSVTSALWCGLPGNLAYYWGICLLLSFVGTNLGLAISAISRSEELSVALVPTVIIPQIVLAGVVATLEGAPLWFAKFGMTSFWGQKLLERVLPESDQIPSDFEPGSFSSLAMILIHGLVFLTVTWIGLRFVEIKDR